MTIVLANPSSSGFTGGALRAVLTALGPDAEAIWPEHAEATVEVASRAGADGQTVVAMGGDGMVHHVARGLVGTEGRLGIVPVGTTNVLARLLGIPSNPVAAAEVVAGGSVERIATATAHYETMSGTDVERPVLFSLGVGWDAEVVAAAETEPYRKASGGVRLYARAAVKQLRREVGRLPDLTVSTVPPADATDAIAIQVQVRDTYTFAGPVRMRVGPAPVAGFTVAIWRRITGPSVIPLAAATRREVGLLGRPEVDVVDATDLEIEASHSVRLQIDGEPLGELRHLRVGVGPGLDTLVP